MLRVLSIIGGSALALVVLGAALFFRFVWVPEIPEPSLSGRLLADSIVHEGRTRTWATYVPLERAESAPLVFVLHGSMGSGARARSGTYYEFDRLADRFGFLAVYPDGFENHWNGCRRAGPYAANQLDVDDVGFLSGIALRLERELGADPRRVFATGISNGAQMAMRLAFEAPERFLAVAPIAAGVPDDANFGCERSGKPVSLLMLNGTDDPMNPYGGGTVIFRGVWGNRGSVLSTEDSVAYWAELAGHTGPPVVDRFPDLAKGDDSWVERRSWRSDGVPEVSLYTVHGGGHTVPHPRFRYPRMLGPTNADIDAAGEIWSFFARQGPG